MRTDADVAIVGYGPVGQALAIAMAQRGYRVLVLERWPSLYSLPRAIAYDHEVARILQSLGVAEGVAPHTALSARYEWRDAQGRVLKSFEGLDQTAISGWPDKVTFSQPFLERILDTRARSFEDRITVVQGWQVVSAVEEDDEVALRAVPTGQASGEERLFKVDYVVGCDGADSFVRKAMGSDYDDLGFSADWLVVDVVPNDPARWTNELIQVCDPARPTTNVSGGPGRRRFEFMLLPDESKDAMNNVETAWRLLEQHGWTRDSATLERHAVYTFRGCVARSWRNGRMMIAGDAAHLTPPFAGQGLCAGMRDVVALAWRLDLVLRGAARPALLDTYGLERGHHVRRFIDFAIELGHIICVLDPAAAAERDAYLLGPGRQTEDRYPDSRLPASYCQREGDPLAGTLSLQGRVKVGESVGRFDDLVGGGFILLGIDVEPDRDLDAGQRQFLDRAGIRVVRTGDDGPVIDIDGSYRRWFRELGCKAVLIRPDFYLFGGGEAAEVVSDFRQRSFWVEDAPPEETRDNGTGLIRDFFAAKLEAQVSPGVFSRWMREGRQDYVLVDVRNPHDALKSRIKGAYVAPENGIAARHDLPADKLLVLYGWDELCSLAASAALQLMRRGYRVKELAGGIKAWQTMGLPVSPVEEMAERP